MTEGTISDVATSRPRRRWLRIALVALLVAGVAIASAGYLYITVAYMPVRQIGGGPDSRTADSVYVRTTPDEFGTTQFDVFCSTPKGRFAVMVELYNDGPLPLTVLGGDPGPGGLVDETHNVNGFSLRDVAAYRQPVLDYTSQPTDWRSAPALPATTVEPGATIDLWARYQMGGMKLLDGAATWTTSIWLRYSVVGIERTAEVPLMRGVTVVGDCSH